MRKSSAQIEQLLIHFERNPVWDFATKVALGDQLGMTLAQVSKWNWDHRKKLGIDTAHKR